MFLLFETLESKHYFFLFEILYFIYIRNGIYIYIHYTTVLKYAFNLKISSNQIVENIIRIIRQVIYIQNVMPSRELLFLMC